MLPLQIIKKALDFTSIFTGNYKLLNFIRFRKGLLESSAFLVDSRGRRFSAADMFGN